MDGISDIRHVSLCNNDNTDSDNIKNIIERFHVFKLTIDQLIGLFIKTIKILYPMTYRNHNL